MNSKKEQENKNIDEKENDSQLEFKEDQEKNDELSLCQNNLEKLEKEKNEFLAGWQRERADFLNYKKEQTEAFDGLKKFVKEDLIIKFLQGLDNLDLALKHIPESLREDKWVEGVIKTRETFLKILEDEGVKIIKSIGEKFNPEFHEAMGQIESDENEEIIIEEIQKGYLMNGKVIRPARVMVSAKKINGSG